MDVLVLPAGSGDCALFLVLKCQPCDYFFFFFSSSILNPLHHMQNLCCRVLVHFICISPGCGTNLVCPLPLHLQSELVFQNIHLHLEQNLVSHCPVNVPQSQ